jgi:hypothetical protein
MSAASVRLSAARRLHERLVRCLELTDVSVWRTRIEIQQRSEEVVRMFDRVKHELLDAADEIRKSNSESVCRKKTKVEVDIGRFESVLSSVEELLTSENNVDVVELSRKLQLTAIGDEDYDAENGVAYVNIKFESTDNTGDEGQLTVKGLSSAFGALVTEEIPMSPEMGPMTKSLMAAANEVDVDLRRSRLGAKRCSDWSDAPSTDGDCEELRIVREMLLGHSNNPTPTKTSLCTDIGSRLASVSTAYECRKSSHRRASDDLRQSLSSSSASRTSSTDRRSSHAVTTSGTEAEGCMPSDEIADGKLRTRQQPDSGDVSVETPSFNVFPRYVSHEEPRRCQTTSDCYNSCRRAPSNREVDIHRRSDEILLHQRGIVVYHMPSTAAGVPDADAFAVFCNDHLGFVPNIDRSRCRRMGGPRGLAPVVVGSVAQPLPLLVVLADDDERKVVVSKYRKAAKLLHRTLGIRISRYHLPKWIHTLAEASAQ